ncbi:MAG: sulfatase-like hydrolase/transferase [Alphaproteobacteria bacterium]|nr:sulfatase-like hydrolase/transferase [Alphaproteobacteria bacterium]
MAFTGQTDEGRTITFTDGKRYLYFFSVFLPMVPTGETMLPQLLKTQGYRTLMIGKWHLGETAATRPEARGFDEYLGFLAGAERFLPSSDPNVVEARQDFDPIDKFLWANAPFAVVNNNRPGRSAPSQYMTDYFSDEAVKAIDANKNRPFFLYLAYNAPHTPLQALKSDYDALSGIENHRLRVYAAMIKALDRGVGSVLNAVKAAGIDGEQAKPLWPSLVEFPYTVDRPMDTPAVEGEEYVYWPN